MTTIKLGAIVFSVLFLTACQSTLIVPKNPEAQLLATDITDQRLPEISGLAISNLRPSHLWAINDSGNSSSIYLIDQNLSVAEEILLNIENRDWEDLAAFFLHGEAWIVIADSGDNLHRYDDYRLYFYRENDLLNAGFNALSPEFELSYTYEHGSLNSEAITVDVTSGSILLFGKTSDSTPVYRLPLSAMHSAATGEAKLIATIPAFSNNPATSLISALTGVNLDSTTAATISDDGLDLFLLTYSDIWRVARHDEQSWPEAFQLKAEHFARHRLHQAEALASDSTNRKLFLTSERLPAPVLTFDY